LKPHFIKRNNQQIQSK